MKRGRPAKGKQAATDHRVSVRLSDDEYSWLQAQNSSISEAVRKAIKKARQTPPH